MTEHTLITPRRNFLIRALGFTAAGTTLPIAIIAADDAEARAKHHAAEMERAWRDLYGRTLVVGDVSNGAFMISAPDWISRHEAAKG